MKRRLKPKLLAIGDVIKTHPRDGFWGCAVVLNARGKTEQFNPFCHIGITPIVFQRDYEWSDIADLKFSILEFDRGVRIAPNVYATRHETCIGIYDARPHPEMPIIGQVNPSDVFSGPLGFEVGDATNGKWPLCGRVSTSLGNEAVVVWRTIHDRAKWLSDVEASREFYEAYVIRTREEAREKRLKAKHKKDALDKH